MVPLGLLLLLLVLNEQVGKVNLTVIQTILGMEVAVWLILKLLLVLQNLLLVLYGIV
jgi:hypothetical protein